MSAKVTRHDGPAGRFYEIPGDPNPERTDGLYPSVTHILSLAIAKPALVYWSANVERAACLEAAADLQAEFQKAIVQPVMPRAAYLATLTAQLSPAKAHQKELAKAADIGSATHKAIEHWLRTQIGAEAGPEPVIGEQSLWGLMSFQDWWKSVGGKVLLLERTIYSKTYGYAGTLDLLARVNGVITNIEIKSSRSLYPEHLLQAIAYEIALVGLGYLPPAGGSLLIRVPKNVDDPKFEVVKAPPAADLFPVFLAAKQLWQWAYANEQAYRNRTTTTKVA
jgi:hypothetical protein